MRARGCGPTVRGHVSWAVLVVDLDEDGGDALALLGLVTEHT